MRSATIAHDKQLIKQNNLSTEGQNTASLEVFADARKTDYVVKRRKEEPGGTPNGLHIKDAGNVGCTSP
jgi:hypothetical protein